MIMPTRVKATATLVEEVRGLLGSLSNGSGLSVEEAGGIADQVAAKLEVVNANAAKLA